MPNPVKSSFLDEMARKFGSLRKLPNSQSLFEVGQNDIRLYYRYSKKHPGNRTFFGLRKVDLLALEGHKGIICFSWDHQQEPLFVPFTAFEELFAGLTPANDGQIKVQVYEQEGGTELYIANAGRFNVESYIGWDFLESMIRPAGVAIPVLSHSQVQTLLGGIGVAKGYDIWIPPSDRAKLDWSLTHSFRFKDTLPSTLSKVKDIAEAIDVIWIDRGGGNPSALYEVEHSTTIYSGLLRFNDVHLTLPNVNLRFGIVSNEERRAVFAKQLGRPTFAASGLREICTFLEYRNVFEWHNRVYNRE